MRIARLILAGLLAASLAVLPVSAAVTMTHATNAEIGMGASGDDCPCCKSVRPDACPLAGCYMQAISVAGPALATPTAASFDEPGSQILVGLSLPPNPPPPRF